MSTTLSFKGYRASMEFDTDDKIIVGRVLDIDDIIVFHGISVPEFEANFHAAVNDYIEACAALAQVPQKPASGKMMLRVAPPVHAAALKAAASQGLSLNKWVESLIETSTKTHRAKRGRVPVLSAQ